MPAAALRRRAAARRAGAVAGAGARRAAARRAAFARSIRSCASRCARELKDLQRRVGVTFLFVTHDQEEALSMSDRIAVMNAGAVEQVGTPQEMYQRPRTRFVASFLGAMNWIGGVGVRPEAMRISRDPATAIARAGDGDRVRCFWVRCVHVEARLEGGEACIAQISCRGEAFQTGEPVHVWWNPTDEMRLPGMKRLRASFLAPPAVADAASRCWPRSLIICVYSLLTRGAYGGVERPLTLENYTRLFDPLYGVILCARSGSRPLPPRCAWRSASRWRCSSPAPGRARICICSLVILPFWTSFLIRTYAWMFLLRDTGIDQHGARAGTDSRAAADAV